MGIPIITTPLGAVAERVKKFDVGWVSDSVSVAGILKVLTDLELCCMKVAIENPFRFSVARADIDIKGEPSGSYITISRLLMLYSFIGQ